MKSQISRIFFGKNNLVTLSLVLASLALVGLGCRGNKAELKPIPPAYLGFWDGQDGSTVSIRGDNTGDYISGGTEIKNGTAEINESERTVSFTFFGIGKTLTIDQPPAGDRMQLSGVVYRRRGGAADTTSDGSSGSPPSSNSSAQSPFSSADNSAAPNGNAASESNADAPANSEVEVLVKATMNDFTDAIESEDFSDFRANTSRSFQRTFTAPQLRNMFQTFVDKKAQALPSLNGISDSSISYTDGPRVRTERGIKILSANGRFSTSPYPVQFESEYESENGNWKLMSIKVKM